MIPNLDSTFPRHGLPYKIVRDNVPRANAIRGLKDSKSQGPDRVPATTLKDAAELIR